MIFVDESGANISKKESERKTGPGRSLSALSNEKDEKGRDETRKKREEGTNAIKKKMTNDLTK